jgi:uncharacterized coiled-coil protein SlyX
MDILKKMFSSLLLLVFIFSSTLSVNAINVNKNLIITKNTLKNSLNGQKYINQIDAIIEKIWENKKALNKLNTKLVTLKDKLKTKNSYKYKKIERIVNYLDAKVSVSLDNLKKKEEIALIKQEEKELDIMNNDSISDSDIKKVNDKLVKIQLNLLKKWEDNLNFLIKKFDELTNYEEKGNFNLNFKLNHELVWDIKSELKLKNYSVKNSWFDSGMSSELIALIDATPKWWESIKLEFSSFIDFISKDSNIYILLNKLNITDESWTEQFKEIFDIIKKISEKNKYIVYNDKDTEQALELLKSFNSSEIIKDLKETLEKPLFKAYKKEWNRYYLVPTKYACNKVKEISVKFDPFNGSTCSESQYSDILKELNKNWKIYLEIWNKNKLGFEFKENDKVQSFNSYIIFTDSDIEEIASELKTEYKDEWFKFEYIKNNKIDFNINDWDKGKITFNSKLNRNNTFDKIDFNLNIKDWSDEIKSNMKLEYKNISGETTINQNWKEFLKITHKWRAEIDLFELNNKIEPSENPITDIYEKQMSKARDAKRMSDVSTIEFVLQQYKVEKNYYPVNIDDLIWKYWFSLPKDPLGNIEINWCKFGYKYITYWTESFNEYNIEYCLENTGERIVWNYEEWYNDLMIIKKDNYYINWYKTWNKKEIEKNLTKIEANFNLKVDTKYNKNNINIYLDYNEWNSKILELEIDNQSNIEYKKVEIKAPTNTMDLEEAIFDIK